MTERTSERSHSHKTEKPDNNSELKKLTQAKQSEKKHSTEQKEKSERDLANRRAEAEKKIQDQKERSEQKHTDEKEARKKEEHIHKEAEPRSPLSYSKLEKQKIYKQQIRKVQIHLPKGAQTFSKVIHNPAVEKVSDVAGKTIFRSSALIGGSITGLVLGLLVYFVARHYGYNLPTFILLGLLIVGAVIGVLVEVVIGLVRKPQQE